ncbi:unnamed protein product, partial [Ixodes hexagonus]
LSSTVREDVGFTRRAILVGVNLVIILVFLAVLWVSFAASQNRPGHSIAFWRHLFTRSFLFTSVMHFEIILVIVSVLALITSSVGFLGALRENRFFLDIYNFGLIIFITIATIVALLMTVLPLALRNHLQSGVYQDFITSYRDSPDLQQIIDNLQESLRCCGFSTDSFRDWQHNSYFRCADDNPSRERCAVPASCCRVNDTATTPPNLQCGSSILLEAEQNAWKRIYTRSCADAALSYFLDHLVGYITVCIAITLFMIFMLAMSLVLQENIGSLRLIYDVYYENLAHGQEKMKSANVSLPPSPTKSHPLGDDDDVMKTLRQNIERAHAAA